MKPLNWWSWLVGSFLSSSLTGWFIAVSLFVRVAFPSVSLFAWLQRGKYPPELLVLTSWFGSVSFVDWLVFEVFYVCLFVCSIQVGQVYRAIRGDWLVRCCSVRSLVVESLLSRAFIGLFVVGSLLSLLRIIGWFILVVSVFSFQRLFCLVSGGAYHWSCSYLTRDSTGPCLPTMTPQQILRLCSAKPRYKLVRDVLSEV